jgi:peptidyl-prolyl cis-trans isomerase D
VAVAAGERLITAAHLLFSPGHDAASARELPANDPGWTEALERARLAVESLCAISDRNVRAAVFAEMAGTSSDDPNTSDVGGSLGEFGYELMVTEFADALFLRESLEPGDIIGPVRTEFGWHVILYQSERVGEPDDF